MEFPFDVNLLLVDEISVIDRTLKPSSNNPTAISQRRNELCTVIDEIGRASGRAQGLLSPITSANRLLESKHKLYLIKDELGSRGRCAVVGLLKIGNKKLFVYDRHGVQHEVEPLCVLDFYVHESCQRRGYGRKVFEEMLMRERVKVRHIAIDRPSPKFLSFLEKHYNLRAPIPQVNNFVIFDGFFSDRNVPQDSNGRRAEHGKQSFAKREPSNDHNMDNVYGVVQRDRLPPHDVNGALARPNSRPSSGTLQSRMPAQTAMYSRHQATPPPIDLGQAASGYDSSPVSLSPPMLRRDGPSRDYMRLVNVNNNNDYIGRRGGHLASAPAYSQPSSFVNGLPVPSEQSMHGNRQAGTKMTLDSTWKVFGVPPRSLVSVTPGSTSAIANHKYRRTNLW